MNGEYEGRELLEKHARSFRIAARVLGPDEADDAALAYAFCRTADDAVDEAPSPEEGRAAIDRLRDEARGRAPSRPLVQAWLRMALRRGVPVTAGWHLLDAIATDVGKVRVADDAELLRYSYGVAGTVGLMMCGILGATDARARPHAVDLGIAMQLTNIARDVAEDARRGRVYLPASRLRAAGVDPEAVARGERSAGVQRVVGELVEMAEPYYASARSAAAWLPWRGRLAMLLALFLYRAIGHAVVRRGAAALHTRTILGRVRLGIAALTAVVAWAFPRRPAGFTPSHDALAGLPGVRSPG